MLCKIITLFFQADSNLSQYWFSSYNYLFMKTVFVKRNYNCLIEELKKLYFWRWYIQKKKKRFANFIIVFYHNSFSSFILGFYFPIRTIFLLILFLITIQKLFKNKTLKSSQTTVNLNTNKKVQNLIYIFF